MTTDTSTPKQTGHVTRFDRDEKPRRDNHFGTHEDDENAADELGHNTRTTIDISRHKAHKYVKQHADLQCGRQLHEQPWNGGRTAEQIAWLEADVEPDELPDIEAAIDTAQLIDGRGDQLHRTQRAVALSDAEYYPPAETPDGWAPDGTSRYHAARINPETGYINYGLSTWSDPETLTWEKFREAILIYAAEEQLTDEKRDFLVREAKAMKKNPNNDMSDEAILTDVLERFTEEFE